MKTAAYLCLLLIAFSIQAQDRDQLRDRDQIRDYLLLEDKQLLQIRDQDRIQLRDQVTLLDGTVVNADGTYRNPQGDRLRLRDGECLDMDGNRYGSQEQFANHLRFRLQAMEQLHYAFRDGNAYQVQEQSQERLRERTQLNNGAYLYADGSYQLPGQEPMRLREGEALDADGNLYRNEAQYRNTIRLQLQAQAREHFAFRNGNMYRLQEGTEARLQQQFSLQNGMNVFPDGSFQLSERDRLQLRDGEFLDGEGNVYASQEQFRHEAHLRLQASNQEHFIYQNGQMYQFMNWEQTPLRQRLTLENGLVVSPDGTYRLKNRRQQKLGDGECLDPDGNRYASHEQLHQQLQQRFMAMAEPHFVYQDGGSTGHKIRIRSRFVIAGICRTAQC